MTGRDVAIVHARVADEVLQQIGHVVDEVGHVDERRSCAERARRAPSIPLRVADKWLTDRST